MSEMEQLKKNAEEALRLQRHRELAKYIDELGEKTEVAHLKAGKAILIHLVACVGWIASSFVPGEWASLVGWVAFLVSFIYMSWCQRDFAAALGEYRGMHNTLKILGMIDCTCGGHGKKKKRRRTMNEYADVVKGWFADKKAAQDKVYSPV